MSKDFARQERVRHLKLGKKKSVATWRKPKGRDSKMRLMRKSYPASPSVGYKSPRKESGKINGKIPVLVYNTKDLEKVGKNSIAILAKIGAKKKLEVIKVATEKKIQILNIKENKK